MEQQKVEQRADRREFVAKLIAATPDALIVSGLGSPTYDVFASGDRDRNYYLWGAMGGASPIGLGLALAQPDQSVVVITGDGEQLMGIGSLATIGVKQPKNLTIIVLDNGHFGETGMQRSHSSLGTDLVVVAKGFGIADSFSVNSTDSCNRIAGGINGRRRTTFVQVFINADEPPRAAGARWRLHQEPFPRRAGSEAVLMRQQPQHNKNNRYCRLPGKR